MNKSLILGISILIICVGWLTPAEALRLTLKRIIFEGPKRAEVITVVNNSPSSKTYRIGWRHYIMTPTDSLVYVPDDQLPPEIKPVSDMVFFAPRRFTIPAKSSQQVRLMLRRPANLEEGEYRSHLWVREEPDLEKLNLKTDELKRQGTESGVAMQMLSGVTLPIVVRQGNLGVKVSISDLKASQSPGFVNVAFSLNRVGAKSVNGNLEYICNPSTSQEYLLKSVKGIAVYPEINQRVFNKKYEKGQDNGACNTLTVKFLNSPGFDRPSDRLLAEASSSVNSL